jgi:hypothetical protein
MLLPNEQLLLTALKGSGRLTSLAYRIQKSAAAELLR